MKALKRADNIIEELTIDLEKYKNIKRANAPSGIDLLSSHDDFANSLRSRSYPSCLEHGSLASPLERVQMRDEIASDNNPSVSYLYPASSKLVELTKAHLLEDNSLSSVRNLFPDSTRRESHTNIAIDRPKSCNQSGVRTNDVNCSNHIDISVGQNSSNLSFNSTQSFSSSSKNALFPDYESSPFKKIKVEHDL